MEMHTGELSPEYVRTSCMCGLSLLAFESLQDFEVYIAFQTQPDRRIYHNVFFPPFLSIDQYLERAPEPQSRHSDALAVANLHHGLHNLLEEALSFTAQHRYSGFLPDLHFL